MSLDDKLREIGGHCCAGLGCETSPRLTENQLAQIKQAFADESWTLQQTLDYWNKKGYMTGQEWAKQILDGAKDENGNIDPQAVLETIKELMG